MKRIVALVLCINFLISMAGCSLKGSDQEASVIFYYLQSEEDYKGHDGIIAAVEQENLSASSDVYYLLAFYLNGPADSRYRSPFPAATKIISVKEDNGVITVITNSKLASLAGLELTNACACLALTCMNLMDAQQVSIQYLEGDELIQIMDLSLEDILLTDQLTYQEDGGIQ